jgi:hypothetical protein
MNGETHQLTRDQFQRRSHRVLKERGAELCVWDAHKEVSVGCGERVLAAVVLLALQEHRLWLVRKADSVLDAVCLDEEEVAAVDGDGKVEAESAAANAHQARERMFGGIVLPSSQPEREQVPAHCLLRVRVPA